MWSRRSSAIAASAPLARRARRSSARRSSRSTAKRRCRQRRQAACARPAHRRLRRAYGRRPVAGGRDPEGPVARQRGSHRVRRADGVRRGRQHRKGQGGVERRRHRLRRRRPQLHPGRAGVRRSQIIAVDVEPGKLAAAREFGATHTINAKSEDVRARVVELTGGRKADGYSSPSASRARRNRGFR